MIRKLIYAGVCFISFMSCKDENYGWKLSHTEILDQSDEAFIKSQKRVMVEHGD